MSGSDQDADGGTPGVLPALHISSEHVGGAAALEAFSESVDNVFTAQAAPGAWLDSFFMKMTVYHLGPMVLGRFRSSPQRFERSKRTIAAGLDHFLFQLYIGGGFSGLAGRRDVRVRAGDICIFDLQRTLRTRTVEFDNITFVVPRAYVEALTDHADALHGTVLRGDEPLPRLLAAQMRLLFRVAPRLSGQEARIAARGTLAMMVSAAGEKACGAPIELPVQVHSPFRAALAFIDTHLHEPGLDPGQVAAALGLSRGTLYRMFRPLGGVAEFIRVRRLAGALGDLTASEPRPRKISEIAYGWGFSSESAFSRSFRAHFGIAPMQARNSGRPMGSLPELDNRAPASRRFRLWLKTLSPVRPGTQHRGRHASEG